MYTYLIDLKKIIEANWRLFESDFARVQEVVGSQKDFLSLLERLNETRNRYAHPVRAPEPDSEKFREDVIFLSDLVNKIQGFFVAQ